MIEIGDLVNLYNGDLHYPNGNGDVMHQGMEQTDRSALHIHSTVSWQSSELNSLQEVQLHDGEISCMVDDRGVSVTGVYFRNFKGAVNFLYLFPVCIWRRSEFFARFCPKL